MAGNYEHAHRVGRKANMSAQLMAFVEGLWKGFGRVFGKEGCKLCCFMKSQTLMYNKLQQEEGVEA